MPAAIAATTPQPKRKQNLTNRLKAVALACALLLSLPVAHAQMMGVGYRHVFAASGGSGPTYFASAYYQANGAPTVTTTSDSCPAPHVKIILAEGYEGYPNNGGTMTLSTTTTNTLVPIAGGGWPGGTSIEYSQAWYVYCNGSTGTYTVTSSANPYTGLTVYEATSGTFDAGEQCGNLTSGDSAQCSVTTSAAGLGIGITMNSLSGQANSGVTGWTNRLNVSQSSVWDQSSTAGTVTLPAIYQGANYSVTLVVNLK
jgi:hypothetical protein